MGKSKRGREGMRGGSGSEEGGYGERKGVRRGRG